MATKCQTCALNRYVPFGGYWTCHKGDRYGTRDRYTEERCKDYKPKPLWEVV